MIARGALESFEQQSNAIKLLRIPYERNVTDANNAHEKAVKAEFQASDAVEAAKRNTLSKVTYFSHMYISAEAAKEDAKTHIKQL